MDRTSSLAISVTGPFVGLVRRIGIEIHRQEIEVWFSSRIFHTKQPDVQENAPSEVPKE
jgi:hypothetical protein